MFYINFFVIIYLLVFQFFCIAQSTSKYNSVSNATESGLIFEKESDYKFVDSSYTDTIQLLSLSKKAHALQFRLLINKSADDSTIIIFDDIKKGSDLNDPSWLMDYNLIKGQVNLNDASQDEIYVVLYNLNLDDGLLPGDYFNLFLVTYKIAHIPRLQKDIKTSMKITHAEASTNDGSAIDITPSNDEYQIIVKKK